MSLRSGVVDYHKPLLRRSGESSARWWLVGQGGSIYCFDRPKHSRSLPSRVFYATGFVILVLAAVFVLFSALDIREMLQGLFLLLALTD